MRSWYKYLIYISLIFLGIALYKANYLRIPKITSPFAFIGSSIFLFTGFINITVSWKYILEKSNYNISLRECLAGTGLSIFGKYIPGKVWIIMGRAVYISEKRHYSLGKLSAISLNDQLITLWAGLVLGVIGLFFLNGLQRWGWVTLILLLCLGIFIFTNFFHGLGERIVKTFLGKQIRIPSLSIKSTLMIMPWFIMSWVFWSVGFYFLILSLGLSGFSWSIGLGFPLACTLGIMAVIAPGGLGAREGVLVGYLTLSNIPITEATTIALASRLWFLMGEIFIFVIGLAANKNLRIH